jgi:hypothetical protein
MKISALLGFLLLLFFCSSAQVTPPVTSNKADSINKADTLKIVKILSADRYGYQKQDSLTETLLLVGNVALQQEFTKF